jgi:hypothetical protein
MNMDIPILLAEVSDKIPSKGAFLVVGLIFLCTVSVFAVRQWLWLMLLELTIIVIGIWMIAQELILDTSMRAAILKEQGTAYYVIAFTSLVLPVITGIALYARKKRTPANRASDATSKPTPGAGSSSHQS